MRKENYITLQDDGNEIMFRVMQMDAMKQTRWVTKALLLLASAGIVKSTSALELEKLSQQFEKEGLTLLFDILGKLDYDKVQPLFDEMLTCVAHVPDRNNRGFVVQLNADNIGTVVGDFKNVYKLAFEAVKINFFNAGSVGNSRRPQKQADIVFTKRMSM